MKKLLAIISLFMMVLPSSIAATENEEDCIGRYKIYQTDNIYSLLKLDTKTGSLWLVYWSLEDNGEGTYVLHRETLVNEKYEKCHAFELYPTKNMYQFILLNTISGQQWHVQWGFESAKRWIRKIY